MTGDLVAVIGGGAMGLAIAIEMKLRGAKVIVLRRDRAESALYAAAGMLAPDAERVPAGAMRDLCGRSRDLYPQLVTKLEELTGINCGFWACGILTPVYDQGSDRANISQKNIPATSQPENIGQQNTGYWLDREALHTYQPGLGADVMGGWWYPDDGQVDNRLLAQALEQAAHSLGVEIRDGVSVEGLLTSGDRVNGLQTSTGIIKADHYILAAGAWSSNLLPLPVRPKKGQMLRLRVPQTIPELPLTRILFGDGIYIVPRRDKHIIIGATIEEVGFTPGNTPQGIQQLLQQATDLFPQLAHYPIEEMWWGFRPTTPDELPILGKSPWHNFTLATGHHRNGILLIPITAQLIADAIASDPDPLLENFSYQRWQNLSSGSSPTFSSLSNSSSPSTMFTHTANFTNGYHKNTSTPTSTSISETTPTLTPPIPDTPLEIAGKKFISRLMTGTGKYRNIPEMQQSVIASGCQIVTVAVRRVQTNAPGHEGLAEALDWSKIWMLPNTAGCQTAEDAVRVARLGREMAKLLGQEDNNFVKLEVIPDPKYLLPDPIGTLQAAEQLVKEGFAVLPYINADPMLAKHLEEAGCATVMPLAAPIGSGQGLQTAANIAIIIENAHIPVVVDAGIGTPSEASQAMEMGADALLINSAIALAQNPVAMAFAMNAAAVAGRTAYLAGRMPIKPQASPSSPVTGVVS